MAGGLAWDESYLGKLRAAVGDSEVLLFVGARGVLRDEAGRVLLIQRSDNGYWALPAGAMELGESVAENAAREVFEETGLTVTALTPFAIWSGLAYTFTNMYGHTYQLNITTFRIDAWTGDLVTETDETTDARWYAVDALPEPLSGSVRPTLAALDEYEATGRFALL